MNDNIWPLQDALMLRADTLEDEATCYAGRHLERMRTDLNDWTPPSWPDRHAQFVISAERRMAALKAG